MSDEYINISSFKTANSVIHLQYVLYPRQHCSGYGAYVENTQKYTPGWDTSPLHAHNNSHLKDTLL